ncbi:MAG: hypothetical protein NTZ19_07605 [Bacteroidetes bacterium]|nr:hypothetical protein [Bacteroidota bacterium]
MKQSIRLFLFLFFSLFLRNAIGQDVLPEFKLKLIAPGKATISWHNPFHNCIQLSVQRSEDNKKFKTIISAKNPSLYENSFTDTKSPKNKICYYRIQYTMKGGTYSFSKTHNTFEKVASKDNPSNWTASPNVFTNKSGYIQIQLNNTAAYVYRLVFLDENGSELFQMKKIASDNLIIDKANFPHAGWFNFELYKDEILLEKNKVLLKASW